MWNAQVTRARDRTADTVVFSFLREHIKGTRARLERMRDVTQQSIRVLQGQMQQGRAWVAELLLLAREHWQGGVAVDANMRTGAEGGEIFAIGDIAAFPGAVGSAEGELRRFEHVAAARKTAARISCAAKSASV